MFWRTRHVDRCLPRAESMGLPSDFYSFTYTLVPDRFRRKYKVNYLTVVLTVHVDAML